ncbi:MAG: nitroreductase/quinone reductase family protein [Actinomycetota bacterium]|nr:nitroreductase/quinone reductase family protein [Actinomycetota bacterium]
MSDWNTGIIEEFRANQGRVASFEKQPLLLLHHRGAKTGTERVSPLAYRKVDGGYAVFASKAGADTNPNWYHNLMAYPLTKVEVGSDIVEVHARVAKGDEHNEIWSAQKDFNAVFAKYEEKTARSHIPVVVLDVV